jgi:hypothetical protein
MSDNNVIPISDEQAKLGQEVLKTGRELGSVLSDIFGDLPKDLVGLLAGDRVKAWRAKRIVDYWADVKKHMKDRGLLNPEPLSLKLAIPILESVADENREELRDLWARLTAAAMDPNRRDLVRQSLVAMVRQMDPTDVIVFRSIAETRQGAFLIDQVRSKLKISQDEITVSLDNLIALNCVHIGPSGTPVLKPLGTLLMRAVT